MAVGVATQLLVRLFGIKSHCRSDVRKTAQSQNVTVCVAEAQKRYRITSSPLLFSIGSVPPSDSQAP